MSFTARGAGSACFICKCSEINELQYGKVLGKWRIKVHAFCLLLTTKLEQNGDPDKDGMYGFFLEDIKTEEKRIKTQWCYLCKARYANISCCAKKCFRTYHTICGTRAGCLNEFAGRFRSWCPNHIKLDDSIRHDEDEQCKICCEEIGTFNRMESMIAPCCKNGWFHRRCVALFAFTAGYFFKCPLCNSSTDEFKKAIQLRGVFIPQSDVAWEQAPNAYGELLNRPSVCDAEDCSCPQGRNFFSSVWSRRMCEACGSTCRHDLCFLEKSYVCNVCQPIMRDPSAGTVLAGQTKGVVQKAPQSKSNDQIQQRSGESHRRKSLQDPSPTTPDNNGEAVAAGVDTIIRPKKSKPRRQKSSDDNRPFASETPPTSTGGNVEIDLDTPGPSGVANNSRTKKNKQRKSVPDQTISTSDASNGDDAAASTVESTGVTQQRNLPTISVKHRQTENREDDACDPALPSNGEGGESGEGATNSRAKKNKPKRRKSVLLMVPQDKDTRSSDDESDSEEMFAKRCKLLVVDEPEKDHVELFVASVAASLRMLSLENFCAAKKEINDLLFKFELIALGSAE